MNNYRIKTSSNARFSYPHLLTPVAAMNGGPAKYSACIIISKNDPCLDSIRNVIEQVYRDNSKLFEDGNGNIIPFEKIRSPLRDGDTDRPGDTYFAGCCFLNAYSFSAPVVVDANNQLITNENLLSSGMTGRAVLTFYPYNRGGNAGIGAGLEGVQKLGDNRRSAILAEFE